ncbi:hypothetical protein [Absidia glauca]|uniref:Uncharacterized protein n=1 Tax=Absidia glauca TaxID=4829 RepID=A0A163JJM8_ABSGL|nr:hypothetical protein [Absidia glauca]
MTYRLNYQASDKHDDIPSGTHYQSLKNAIFANEFDIAIGLYIDGFSATSKPSISLTMVNVVNLNPSKYSVQGMEVLCDDGATITSKVSLLLASGDIPAAAALSGHIGHTARSGCRIVQSKVSMVKKEEELYLEGGIQPVLLFRPSWYPDSPTIRRKWRHPHPIEVYYYGDVHFYLMHRRRFYAVRTLSQTQYDHQNRMYFTTLQSKTVVLDARSIVGDAGSTRE